MIIYLTEGPEKMVNRLIINQIIPFSNVDGQGNRCAIFLQECNSACIYCHNPETMTICNNCGKCVEVCPRNALYLVDNRVIYNKELCVNCNMCIKMCPNNSSPKTREYFIDELVDIIKSYQPYIRGITVSGGEPTLQKDGVINLFNKVKELGLSCYLETNGFFDLFECKTLISCTDKFLFDVKTVDNIEKVCRVRGQNNLQQLKYLLSLNKVEEVRTVVIKNYMDGRKTVEEVSKILLNYPDVIYKITKVRPVGLKEYQIKLIENYIPSDDEILSLVNSSKQIGIKNAIYVI